jgi:putative N6-adenine-specific DNA methylase
MEEIFVVTAPGVKPYALDELKALGLAKHTPKAGEGRVEEPGGVTFFGDQEAIYRANLHLRTASRVLVRLGSFRATAFSELRKKAGRLDWERYVLPGQPLALRVTCHKSRLYHSDAVAERVVGAAGDRLGKPARMSRFKEDDQGEAAQLVVVRMAHDICTISIDSSGETLHRRGYRLATAKAPLRETLAATILLASGWDPGAPLLDPFCGSGTIPIEAAMLARRLAPGRGRRFAFMDWPGFDRQLWDRLLAEAQAAEKPLESDWPILFGSDRDAGAVKLAEENAGRAGVLDQIHFSCRPVSAIEPPARPGWVVTNPPYGVRVSANRDLRNLYAQFGKVLRASCQGWRVAMLCNDPQLIANTGLKFGDSLALVNGGVAVRLVRTVVTPDRREGS